MTDCKVAYRRLPMLMLVLGSSQGVAQDAAAWIDLAKQEDAAVFVEKCGMCHRGGGMGTGILGRRLQGDLSLLENRTDLRGEYIETVVRTGLGLMYPLGRAEVSEEQLQRIQRYLVKQP